MKKTGIFYGSSTGTCEDLANQIADKMGVAASDVHSADKLSADLVKEYDLLILGTSTWGDGELQDDWYDGIKVLKSADLSFKSIALFGCGDSGSYPDTFCDAVGLLYEECNRPDAFSSAPTNPWDTTSRTRSSAPTAGS